MLVSLDVLSNFLDTLGKDRNLNLWRANIILAACKFLNRLGFVIFSNQIESILAYL